MIKNQNQVAWHPAISATGYGGLHCSNRLSYGQIWTFFHEPTPRLRTDLATHMYLQNKIKPPRFWLKPKLSGRLFNFQKLSY